MGGWAGRPIASLWNTSRTNYWLKRSVHVSTTLGSFNQWPCLVTPTAVKLIIIHIGRAYPWLNVKQWPNFSRLSRKKQTCLNIYTQKKLGWESKIQFYYLTNATKYAVSRHMANFNQHLTNIIMPALEFFKILFSKKKKKHDMWHILKSTWTFVFKEKLPVYSII